MPLPVAISVSKHITSKDVQEEICQYVHRNLEHLLQQWQDLRTNKITAWRKVYRGTPREKYKSFPWKNAANLVPKIVSSFSDQLTARLIMGTYGVDPLFPTSLVGTFKPEEDADKQREAIETFLSQSAKSPLDINLFPAQSAWAANTVKYGFSVMKDAWETCVEQMAEGEAGGKVVFRDIIKHDGPRPQSILFENFLCPLNVSDFERAPFLAHIIPLTEMQLKDRVAQKLYSENDVKIVLAMPDRYGPQQSVKMNQEDIAGSSGTEGTAAKEYDLYECYFPYLHNGKRFHLIATYHKASKVMLRCVFNFFPDNSLPFRMMRLGSDGESILGMGFCNLLGMYQEEIAQIHNQRRDAGTLATTTIIRAARGSQLDTNFSVYPMAVLPGEEGEYEFVQIGRAMTETIKEEQMTLQLATDAAGVGPAASGSGAGTVNKKGAYSAMGTFATNQEGNTRANYHQTTFRFAHLTLGNSLLRMYAHFGVAPSKLKSMGEMGEHLQKALENVKAGRLWIPVYAATGSINKEIEKQNLLLLNQQFHAHWQGIAGMLAAMDNPMTPPDVKNYTLSTIKAANILMTKIARDFGIEDPSQVIPEAQVQQQQGQPPQGAPGQPPPGQAALPLNAAPGINPDAIKLLAQQTAGPRQ